MKPDAIFRIASMTKPIVSLAAMILQEEGKLGLGDPVSRYLPELKGMQVATEKAGADGRKELVMEPVQQEMTVQDLLRHTSGLTYGSYRRDMVSDLYRDANLFEPGSSLTDMIAKLSKLPLAFQPGTTWDYGVSIDVLGRIVEVASGMDLANFINQRITTPLGMNDTGFWVEHRKLSRLAQPQLNSATGKRPALHDVATRPTLFSGGGGMVSTARDYARLCQMFLNGGSLDGVRLVSRKTIAQMTADQLPLGVKAGVPFAPRSENGQGFGLGFAVRTAEGRNPNPGSIGDYGWTGSSGTTFWIDPKEQLFVIALTQEPAVLKRYISLLRSLVYQSITD